MIVDVIRVLVTCDRCEMPFPTESEYCNLQEARDDGWSLAEDRNDPESDDDLCPACVDAS